MSRDQIDEIAWLIDEAYDNAEMTGSELHGYEVATHIYNAGYRKQSEGEWIKKLRFSRNYDDFFSYICSKCGSAYEEHSNFCPNCGRKMKGGAE